MHVQRQYALKQIFMKIEFENSVRRLSILCRITDIKISWINPCIQANTLQHNVSLLPLSPENIKNSYFCCFFWLL